MVRSNFIAQFRLYQAFLVIIYCANLYISSTVYYFWKLKVESQQFIDNGSDNKIHNC